MLTVKSLLIRSFGGAQEYPRGASLLAYAFQARFHSAFARLDASTCAAGSPPFPIKAWNPSTASSSLLDARTPSKPTTPGEALRQLSRSWATPGDPRTSNEQRCGCMWFPRDPSTSERSRPRRPQCQCQRGTFVACFVASLCLVSVCRRTVALSRESLLCDGGKLMSPPCTPRSPKRALTTSCSPPAPPLWTLDRLQVPRRFWDRPKKFERCSPEDVDALDIGCRHSNPEDPGTGFCGRSQASHPYVLRVCGCRKFWISRYRRCL
ncbi:hypothetical protein C8T65DRAFT_109561 [Cerioporus squamosus]|nr:hypothetical protein C8T65DRAFT_109561 [Cerioporus squamosus]